MLRDPASLLLLGYFGVLIGAAGLEGVFALHPQRTALAPRWRTNIGLGIINAAALMALLPLPLIGVAALRHAQGGPLDGLPEPAAAAALVLAIDFLRYWSHRLLHGWSWLWPVHAPHHADNDIDVTTGLRFHPAEALLEAAIQAGLVWVLAPSAFATALAAVTLAASNFLTHANIRLPDRLERTVRAVLVTPDVHRVHHSICATDQRCNFAALLTLWDRLFATYAPPPPTRCEQMGFGLRDPASAGLVAAIRLPWRLYRRRAGQRLSRDSA